MMWPKPSSSSIMSITCPRERSSFKVRPTRCAQESSPRSGSSFTASPTGRCRFTIRRRNIGRICSHNDSAHRRAPARARRAHREQLGLASGIRVPLPVGHAQGVGRSEEHTSELQSLTNLVCRLLLEKKKKTRIEMDIYVERAYGKRHV